MGHLFWQRTIELALIASPFLVGAVAGWLARRPRWVLVVILLGALAAGVYFLVLLREPSFFENDEDGDLWKVFAAIACLILWAAWSVGVVAGALFRRRRATRARS